MLEGIVGQCVFEGPLVHRVRWRWVILIVAALLVSSIPSLVPILGVNLPPLISSFLLLGGLGSAVTVGLVTQFSSSINLREEYGGGCVVYYLHKVKDETLWAHLSSYPSSTYVANPAMEDKSGVMTLCGIASQSRCYLFVGPPEWGKSRGIMRLIQLCRQEHPQCRTRWRKTVSPFHPKLIIITGPSLFDTDVRWIRDLKEPVVFVCDDLQKLTDEELNKLERFVGEVIRPHQTRMFFCAIRSGGEHRLPEGLRQQLTWIRIGPKSVEEKRLADWLSDLVDKTAFENKRVIPAGVKQGIVTKATRGDFSPLDIVANIKERREDLLERSHFSREIDQARFDQVKNDSDKTKLLCAVRLLKAIGFSPEVKMLRAIYECLFKGRDWQSNLDFLESAGWLTVMRSTGLYAAADSPYDVVEFLDHTFGTDELHTLLLKDTNADEFRCLVQTGGDIRLALGLGTFYGQQNDFEKTTVLFERLAARHPTKHIVHFALGIAQMERKENGEAETAFLEAIRLKPNSFAAWSALATVRENQKKHAEAETAFLEAIRLKPDSSVIWSGLGVARLKQEKYAEAETAFLEAIRLKPNEPNTWSGLGRARVMQEKNAEAEAALREAIRLKPDWRDGWIGLGTVGLNEEEYAEAEAAFREAIRLKPDEPDGWSGLGMALEAQEKYAEAEAALLEAIRLKPDDPVAWFGLGVTRQAQDKHVEAEAALREAIRLKPDEPDGWSILGETLVEQEKHAEAEAALLEAIRLKPDDPVAWFGLGVTRQAQDKHVEAEAAFLEVTRLKPDEPDGWSGLGMNRKMQGKYVEAEQAYRAAVGMNPEDASAWYELGAVLLGRGEREAACSAFKRALEYVDANEELSETVRKALAKSCGESI